MSIYCRHGMKCDYMDVVVSTVKVGDFQKMRKCFCAPLFWFISRTDKVLKSRLLRAIFVNVLRSTRSTRSTSTLNWYSEYQYSCNTNML
jgi:hypothetical protein